MLGHVACGCVAMCIKVDDVGEVFTHELQVHFHTVMVFIDLHGQRVFSVGIRDGAGSSELIAINFSLRAINVDVLKRHRQSVAVRGHSSDGVGLGCGRRAQHREGEQHRQRFVHAANYSSVLIKS